MAALPQVETAADILADETSVSSLVGVSWLLLSLDPRLPTRKQPLVTQLTAFCSSAALLVLEPAGS